MARSRYLASRLSARVCCSLTHQSFRAGWNVASADLLWRIFIGYWWERQPCRGWQKIGVFTHGDGFSGLPALGVVVVRPCRRGTKGGAGDPYRLYGYVFGGAAWRLVMTGRAAPVIYLAVKAGSDGAY